jgi:hypothetical protein
MTGQNLQTLNTFPKSPFPYEPQTHVHGLSNELDSVYIAVNSVLITGLRNSGFDMLLPIN